MLRILPSLVAVLTFIANIAAAAQPTKPNVILFLVDDMGWNRSDPVRLAVLRNTGDAAFRQPGDAIHRRICLPALLADPCEHSHQPVFVAAWHHDGLWASTPATAGAQLHAVEGLAEEGDDLSRKQELPRTVAVHVGRGECETRDGERDTSANGTSGWPKSIGPSDKGSRWRCTGRRTRGQTAISQPGSDYRTSQNGVSRWSARRVHHRSADRRSHQVPIPEANRDAPFFVNFWQHSLHGPWGFKKEYAAQVRRQEGPAR